MAFGKKPCCAGCARKPSKARISGNPVAHLFQLGGEVGFANGGEARTDIGAAHPEYTHIFPEFESTLGQIGGRLWRPFLRREVLTPEETRNLGDETIRINPETGMHETLSTIEPIPGEYGPIEGVNPWTDWPTATELITSGVGNLWKMRDFLSRPENIEQVAGEAIEGAQDYMTQQVDLANRGLTEAYDPETGEMADFTVPLLAAELMTGGLARPAVQLADNEMLTGMAVRPKKAVVRPASTYPTNPDYYSENPRVRREAMEFDDPKNIQQYEDMLVARMLNQGIDPDIATDVALKAEKYFMTELGTADDPLRQAMLAGTLPAAFYNLPRQEDPEWSSSDTYRDERRAVLESGSENREEFEEAYDRASGVDRTLVDPIGDAWEMPLYHPPLVSEAAQMLSEGVPSDLIYKTVGGWDPDHPLAVIPQWVYETPSTVWETMPEVIPREETVVPTPELPGYLATAYEQGEMVYEIDPSMWSEGLDFLSPEQLAERLTAFTADEIRGKSFPDLVVEAQTRFLPPEIEQRQSARQMDRDSSSIGADQRNARVPTKLKTEVGVTRHSEMPTGRSWYSLDTDNAVELEGALMNHSVGGYSSGKTWGPSYNDRKKKNFADKDTVVYSLRESEGQPRLTTDITYLDLHGNRSAVPWVLAAGAYKNAEVPGQYLEELFELWKSLGVPAGRANPSGVGGNGEQYDVYLDTGEIFSVSDAIQMVNSGLSDVIDPDEYAAGGIVSLVNGCDFNQRRGMTNG